MTAQGTEAKADGLFGNGLTVEVTKEPKNEDIQHLTEKIDQDAHNLGFRGKDSESFGFFVRDPSNQKIIAGCNGCIVLGGIYTDQLWVHPDHRKHGYARAIMEKVEELGRKNDCPIAYLTTMDFQGAVGFYKKIGYEVDLSRKGFMKGSSMLYLKKSIL